MMPHMTAKKSLPELESLLHYTFKDKDVIKKARTRLAHLNDQHKCDEKKSMDPLATLGDAVLSRVVAYKLYNEKNLTKQTITELRSANVRRERTRAFAEKNSLGDFVNWGKGEMQENVGAKGAKAFDTVTEALIGAVFLDAQNNDLNGIKIVGDMLDRMDFFN
jgi:dsRNA-specific ribonuclease